MLKHLKFLFFLLLSCCLLMTLSCSDEIIHRSDQAIQESYNNSNVTESDSTKVNSTDHFELQKKGNIASTSNLIKDLEKLSVHLFNQGVSGSNSYKNNKMVEYLSLYVQIFQIWKANNIDSLFDIKFKKSLDKFKKIYLDPCTHSEFPSCDLVKYLLKKEKSLVRIIIHIIKHEPDHQKKLNLLFIGYDISEQNTEKELEYLYLNTFLDQLSKSSSNLNEEQNTFVKKHLGNTLNIVKRIDWKTVDNNAIHIFERAQPWLVKKDSHSAINFFREFLVSFLPIYSSESEIIRNGVIETVNEIKKQILEDSYDLSKYPAYSNLFFKPQTQSKWVISDFLVLNVFRNIMNEQQAREYILQGSVDIERIYSLSKKLVRWRLAQLSIESTQIIRNHFFKKKIKDQAFVLNVLASSKNIVPEWSKFHDQTIGSFRKLFKAIDLHKGVINLTESEEFFFSINRNILKTVVYPNMLAFIYYMAKTEWKYSYDISTTYFDDNPAKLIDKFITGEIQEPWFDFMNLNLNFTQNNKEKYATGEEKEEVKKTQASLFRFEIVDVIHYFFTTHTHKEYQITADELINTLGVEVMNLRKPILENVVEKQKDLYFSNLSIVNNWVNWCQSIENEEPVDEIIPFFELHNRITPFPAYIQLENNQNLRYNYYSDTYNQSIIRTTPAGQYSNSKDAPPPTSIIEANERFRLEYVPILDWYKQVIDMTQRIKVKSPNTITSDLSQSLKTLTDFEFFKQIYLGSQILITKKLGKCSLVTANQSGRRSRAVAFSEKKYIQLVVQPLIEKILDGTLTVKQANTELALANNYQTNFKDYFVKVNNDKINYITSKISFLLRVRQYLIHGLDIKSDTLGNIKTLPVVGNKLTININADLFTNENNPFMRRNKFISEIRETTYRRGTSLTEFSADVISKLMGKTKRTLIRKPEPYTSWDLVEKEQFRESTRKYKLEFLVQMYQLGDITYRDVSLRKCRNSFEKIVEGCLYTHKTTLKDIGSHMNDLFTNIEINSEKENYYLLTYISGEISRYNIDVQLKLNVKSPLPSSKQGTQEYMPYNSLNGYFDLAYDMLKSNYLGKHFYTQTELLIATAANNGHKLEFTVCGQRNKCFWLHERGIAMDLFLARKSRPGLIFNFDSEILTEQFNYVKKRLDHKLDSLIDLEEQSQDLLDSTWTGSDQIRVELFKELLTMYPLSTKYGRNEADLFREMKTQGFFTQPADWTEYLIHSH